MTPDPSARPREAPPPAPPPAPRLGDARPAGAVEAIIIAHNERLNLPHCLEALVGWVRRVYVVDSGSTDGTRELASELGAQVVEHAWEGYAAQKNWALNTLPLEAAWVLLVDADEVLTAPLKRQIESVVQRPPEEVAENGFFVNRLTYFLNRPIRHCGYFPSWNLRLFKRGLGRYERRAVHEHVVLPDPVGYLREPMLHHDRRGLEHFFAKHNRYSTLEAQQLAEELDAAPAGDSGGGGSGSDRGGVNISADTRRRRWLKRHLAKRLPLPSLWRFCYMYFWQMGILDGRAGLEFCKFIAGYDAMVALKLRALLREGKSRREDKAAVTGVGPAASAEAGLGERRDRVIGAGLNGLSTSEGDLSLAVYERPDDGSPPDDDSGDAATERTGDRRTQMQPEPSPWTFKEKLGRAVWMVAGRPAFRLSFHNWYAYRRLLLRLFGAKIGRRVAVRPTVHIEVPWMLDLDDQAVVGDHAILYSLGPLRIGKRSIISQYAHLCAGTHDYTDHQFRLIRAPVTIEDDCWIGADAFVGPGVTVGRLSVLGARSSAYRSLPPEQVCMGNPAKPVKRRVLR